MSSFAMQGKLVIPLCYRPAPHIKTVRCQARKNDTVKSSARPQRTANTGKKPDPKSNKKDDKLKPVKKEDKKEDNKVRLRFEFPGSEVK